MCGADLGDALRALTGHWITSACAEQTLMSRVSNEPERDHLRVCGADVTAMGDYVGERGSPPRVRSRLFYSAVRDF